MTETKGVIPDWLEQMGRESKEYLDSLPRAAMPSWYRSRIECQDRLTIGVGGSLSCREDKGHEGLHSDYLYRRVWWGEKDVKSGPV